EALKAGADGYYLKKSSNKELSRVIRRIASGSSWFDPGIASAVLSYFIRNSLTLPKINPTANVDQVPKPTNEVDRLMSLVDESVAANRINEAITICQAAYTVASRKY